MTNEKKATWIWYPGDFEIWLGNKFNNRRTERGAMMPPFWKQDSHWPTVEFSITAEVEQTEKIRIAAEGDYSLKIDGELQFGMPCTAIIPRGRHTISIKVHNPSSPPSLFVDGDTIMSGGCWLATYEDKIWIDENGVAHGSGVYVPAAHWDFCDIMLGPSTYTLPRRTIGAERLEAEGHGALADFGRETMGYLTLKEVTGEGMVNIYYGESREEALNKGYCETLDQLEVTADMVTDMSTAHSEPRTHDITLAHSKALRYAYIEATGSIKLGGVALEYEYSPHDTDRSGTFRCNDQTLNRIWNVSAYTLDLTTREFFTDGIKRDRWTWSGDAIQSYLMNYYLRFDTECVKRTIRQLRGKDPVTAHINTIMDYTFYWFVSIGDYHLYTGDTAFVREMYPRMRTMMDYCLSRTSSDGMAYGQADDWIFVDWVDFAMHKRGALCFEQLLFCKSLQVMARCAALLRDNPPADPPQGSPTAEMYAEDAKRYQALAEKLLATIKSTFWDEERHVLTHAIEDGEANKMVTPFPNMFAIIYDLIGDTEKNDILHNVLLNSSTPKITTPYMRFYELESLCMMDHHTNVLQAMKTYWGGMLDEGATTFWEKYDPEEHGTAHLAMYGRPYGKSLCHAWGASPLYILGKYFLGVRPLQPGYALYVVRPILGGLEWMEGEVPTPFGKIYVKASPKRVTVKSDGGRGMLQVWGQQIHIPPGKEVNLTKPL